MRALASPVAKGVRMPCIKNFLGLLPVVALSLYVAGCGSNSTAPQTTPSQYAGSYQGIVAGAGASGTVAITVGQVSTDMTRGPVLHAESSTPVTVTLTTPSGPITLTGTITGNVASVSSTTPPGNCTITFTTTMGATGTCTIPGLGTLSLLAALNQEGIVTTTYCGTQSAGAAATVNPTATLGALVSGTNMYMIVAPPTSTQTLYSGTIASNSVTLMSMSSGAAVYSGAVSGTTSISGTITTGGPGSWSVVNPCVTGALTLSTTSVSATATAGNTTPIPLAPVTISNGGSGTLGVLSVGTVTYGTGATGWLQATLSSPTTTGGTLSLSVLPTGITAATYTATVPVTSSVASGSPQTVTVTLTVSAGQAPPVLSVLQNSYTFQMMQGQGAPGANTDQITLTGGTVPVPLAVTITYPQGATAWLTATLPTGVASISPGGHVILTMTPTSVVSGFPPGSFPATIEITSPGLATVTVSDTLNVQGTSTSCVISPSTMPPFYIGTMVDFQMIGSAGCGTSQVWSLVTAGSLPAGLNFGPGGVLFGTPTTYGNYTFALRVQNTATGNTSTETYSNVSVALSTSCILWPGAPGASSNFLPPGTVGTLYPANSISATPPCTTAGSDNTALWAWTISAGTPPPGLSLSPANGSTTTDLTGTPTGAGGTYTFTITFTNTNQVGGYNEGSASQSYTVTIAP